MSAMHLPPFDEPPFMNTPRDGSYDMAAALDLRPFSFPPGAGPYSLAPYDAPRQSLPNVGYHPGSYELQYPLDDFSPPELAHPVPRHPLSPSLYASESHTAAFGEHQSQWDNDAFTHSASAPAFTEFGEFGQPSMFVSPARAEGKDEAEVVEPQEPPPSWSMSGSLDPATGIYQSAPEHPRVRTAQACEKCRGRKAKCSGEHPVCQRCQIRGLKCEYAAERKMRGPNKVKKNKNRDTGHSRRTSVASTSSIASSASTSTSISDGSPKPPPSRTFTMKLDIHRDVAPSPPGSSGSDMDLDTPDYRHPRPPRIDLSGTRLYDQMPPPQGPIFNYEVTSPTSAAAWRRQSLPGYLPQGYAHGPQGGVYDAPRGIEIVETTVRPRSNPAYPLDAFDNSLSLFPTSHSEDSSSGGSVPITPIGDLAYSVGFPSGDYHFPSHAAVHPHAPQPDFLQYPHGNGALQAGHLEPLQTPQVDFGAFTFLGDADATPTLDRGKGFPAFSHEG